MLVIHSMVNLTNPSQPRTEIEVFDRAAALSAAVGPRAASEPAKNGARSRKRALHVLVAVR